MRENWNGTVLYEPDGDEGGMLPVWLILEGMMDEHDWQETLIVPIDAPLKPKPINGITLYPHWPYLIMSMSFKPEDAVAETPMHLSTLP